MLNKLTTFLKQPFARKNHTEEDFLKELLSEPINQQRLKNIIERCKLNLDWKDAHGDSLLHLCVRKNNMNAITFLCKNGADINIKNMKHLSPLQFAMFTGKKLATQALLNSGADINTPGAFGRTLFQDCVLQSTSTIVESVITKATNINNIDNKGRNVLFDAISNGSIEIISMISKLKGIKKDLIDSAGNTVMHNPIVLNNPQISSILMENGVDPMQPDSKGRGLLYYALTLRLEVAQPHFAKAKKLKYNLSEPLSNGSNLLHVLITYLSNLTEESKINEAIKLFVELIKLGVDCNQKDKTNTTPLMLACKKSQCKIVSILCSIKTLNINEVDNNGYSALMHASMQKNGLNCVDNLLAKGADQEIITNEKTALLLALSIADNKATVKRLLENAANLTLINSKRRNVQHLIALGSADISYFRMIHICNAQLINNIDVYGFTALEYAVLNGKFDLANAIIATGGKINISVKKDMSIFNGELELNSCQNFVQDAKNLPNLKDITVNLEEIFKNYE